MGGPPASSPAATPCWTRSAQAEATVLRRERKVTPSPPNPRIISPQVAGSGTPPTAKVPSPGTNSEKPEKPLPTTGQRLMPNWSGLSTTFFKEEIATTSVTVSPEIVTPAAGLD